MTVPAPKPAKPTATITQLKEYRCSCGKLLIRAHLANGSTVEAYCKTCKRPVTIIAA